MRKCTQYSAEFKEKLLAKAFSPNAPSHVKLARRSGVPYPTLYQWISMSKKGKKVKSVKRHPNQSTDRHLNPAISKSLKACSE